MNPEVLEKILSCKTLPTLPAVAMRVVELSNSDKTRMKDLADTIQNDQALALKILRTVNSSMFGLRTRCASINQAIVMLGLSTVKTLALGFSLVSAIKDCDAGAKSGGTFSMANHWRRALFTGIAGRQIGARAGLANPEEAFLGGLLQDVGMVAMVQALGKEYIDVIAPAGEDHRLVAKLELDAFDTQHPEIGAMLAARWKLPEQLLMPIKYHERPTAAPVEHSNLCRAVGMGNIAADLLTSAEPAVHLRKLYTRGEQWFGLNSVQIDEAVKVITQQTREIASLLTVPMAKVVSAEDVLQQAREAMAAIIIPPADTERASPEEEEHISADDLTGVASRFRLEQLLVGAFEQAKAGVGPLSLAMFELDEFEELNTQFGTDAGDTALLAVAARLTELFRPMNGLVARFSPGNFVILVTRTPRSVVLKVCEDARKAIATEPVSLIAANFDAPAQINVTCSVGIASVDENSVQRVDDCWALLNIVERAVRSAKNVGKNNVRVYAPTAA